MLKLRFSKPNMVQYLDGKISICKYVCTIIDNSTKKIVETFTVNGTAKCSPNDTVNPEFGKKLADSRAKRAAYKHAANRICPKDLNAIIEKIDAAVDIVYFINTMQYLKRKEDCHIKFVCDEVNEVCH